MTDRQAGRRVLLGGGKIRRLFLGWTRQEILGTAKGLIPKDRFFQREIWSMTRPTLREAVLSGFSTGVFKG